MYAVAKLTATTSARGLCESKTNVRRGIQLDLTAGRPTYLKMLWNKLAKGCLHVVPI